MDYDIVVGICTKDCEKTISKLTKEVDKALLNYSGYTSMILCSDGFSKDQTRKIFSEKERKERALP